MTIKAISKVPYRTFKILYIYFVLVIAPEKYLVKKSKLKNNKLGLI